MLKERHFVCQLFNIILLLRQNNTQKAYFSASKTAVSALQKRHFHVVNGPLLNGKRPSYVF